MGSGRGSIARATVLLALALIALPAALSLADCTGTTASPCHMCDVDDMDIVIRGPGGATQEYTGMTFSSSSGTCGTDPEVHETWQIDGYQYCPQEGDYDVKMQAHAEGDTYSWEESTYTSSVYTVDYDSSSSWCSCGGYSWNSNPATDYNNAAYPRCCGDEGSSETWEAAASGGSTCVKGNDVADGSVAPDQNYLAKDGQLHYCKSPTGQPKPYSWVTEWYECDYVQTGSTTYYCGAGGTDKAGEWHTLQNSGCQLVERIRGGRIIVH